MKLDGRTIVITGSTRGIGRAIAEACAAEGAKVVVSSRTEEAVRETCRELAERGCRVSGAAADVSDPQGLERLLRHAVDRHGRIDVWVNNAGLPQGFLPVAEMTEADICRIVDVNLTGTALACRMVIRHFIEEGGGILINMSGKGGRGDASAYTAVYAATKAAVMSLTKSLAIENKGKPLSIHAVLPGMVETDFYTGVKTTPELQPQVENIPWVLKAIGVPKERVGALFVELAAQKPGQVTGKVYALSGGWRMMPGVAKMIWYRATGKMKWPSSGLPGQNVIAPLNILMLSS